jgi:cephalosporin hydroxylase
MKQAEIFDAYHSWFYGRELWRRSYLGVPCLKSVLDLWNYQEIIAELKPALALEFGTYKGGTALFLADLISKVNDVGKVLTVDHKYRELNSRVTGHPSIEFLTCDTTAGVVKEWLSNYRSRVPGPLFAILDSAHDKEQVLKELNFLRTLTHSGDYVVVEDGNMNGHPVEPDLGPGPLEALQEYFEIYPTDYERDVNRENMFGFTFAPMGYLKRQ